MPASPLLTQPCEVAEHCAPSQHPSCSRPSAEERYVHQTENSTAFSSMSICFLVLCSCQPVCSPDGYGALTISNDDKLTRCCLCSFLQEYAALAEAHLQRAGPLLSSIILFDKMKRQGIIFNGSCINCCILLI